MRSLPSGYSFFQVVYSRAHVVNTSTWWRTAMRSAMSRQWYSDPPRISVPYRWMTKAIFTGASCVIRARSRKGREQRVEVRPQAGLAERVEPRVLAADDVGTQPIVVGEPSEQFGGEFQVLRRKHDAGASHR